MIGPEERGSWVTVTIVVTLVTLLYSSSLSGQEYAFMPKGGKALLLQLLGAPADAGRLKEVAQSRRSEAEWRAHFAQAKLTDRERATLAAYLEVNMPLPAEALAKPGLAAALPPDGQELAVNECQSCHSLFTSHLTQSRDVQGWRNIFLSPFHRQMKMSERERDEFARYSALNMPMRVSDVPADLRF